jgi:hypothetical protein
MVITNMEMPEILYKILRGVASEHLIQSPYALNAVGVPILHMFHSNRCCIKRWTVWQKNTELKPYSSVQKDLAMMHMSIDVRWFKNDPSLMPNSVKTISGQPDSVQDDTQPVAFGKEKVLCYIVYNRVLKYFINRHGVCSEV